jgi:hypothetical protein
MPVNLTQGHGASVTSEEDNFLLRGSLVAALVSSWSTARSTQRDSVSGASRHFSTEGDRILLRVVVYQPANLGSSASRALYCAM